MLCIFRNRGIHPAAHVATQLVLWIGIFICGGLLAAGVAADDELISAIPDLSADPLEYETNRLHWLPGASHGRSGGPISKPSEASTITVRIGTVK